MKEEVRYEKYVIDKLNSIINKYNKVVRYEEIPNTYKYYKGSAYEIYFENNQNLKFSHKMIDEVIVSFRNKFRSPDTSKVKDGILLDFNNDKVHYILVRKNSLKIIFIPLGFKSEYRDKIIKSIIS